jgi:uncharacterized SAM-binding protein YcdF (DUF218 family)
LDSPQPNHRNRLLGRTLAVVLVAYAAGFLLFVATLPATPPSGAHADAVVALTGGTERIDAAEALFEGGTGKRLLITGVHPSTTKEELKHLVRGGPRFDCCVDLGFAATNTHGNAEEAAHWARMHGFRSLVVVTANYHMPRSLTEFAAAMPRIRLVPYPVESENINLARWWQDPNAVWVLHLEYAKYLGSIALTSIFPPRSDAADGRKTRRTA